MKHGLDTYAYLKSPIHCWETRCKLVALLALIFTFAFVQQLILLPAMVIVTLIYYSISRLPGYFLLQRLRYPGFFLATLAILLPFTVGNTIIWQLGFLALRQEGLVALTLIVTRFLCILTIGLILFGTAPFLTSIKAMRSLGLPSVLADMTLLSYRYIEQFGEDLTRMQTAMRLRGFRANKLSRRNLTVLASLAGSLLVQSYEQSQQVYQAMILRGYGCVPQRRRQQFKTHASDLIALLVTCFVAFGFVIAEIILAS
ncbi:cobalt ECF transporter T component CbiQ [Gloeocapsopsis dulcis]|uniref:Cobalt ECF transporter T component CbiQ n=1 Tax=Gloeocapsopsis dulcis AAB1 = 1H9 TaxID=1433147 RepID=A0A6N8G5M0_9CHRO|nr:cobalt ECF transporter T component CbiQ [Gloeocapsopsis dulcis]MUL39465.1 cobalt ECF transporter T component CbiQ [Gloeocapsopsis dulcis AAB1 = 1H9]WNN91676.1 cobalt ECF transporter T component CbiQ [Gloeocapsopsis dulcis]